MDIETLSLWLTKYPPLTLLVVAILSYLVYRLSRKVIARTMYQIVVRTENVYDDLIVDHLHPFRIAWIVPASILAFASSMLYGNTSIITKLFFFLIIGILTYTVSMLLDALVQIYEHSPSYSGVSIQGYTGLAKILVVLIAIILSVALFTGKSPVVLLSGIGAFTAVLLLLFQDTLLSFIASIQIATQDLIKEGDFVAIPSYDADGVVTDITLHTLTIQNFDNTITTVPIRKITQSPYKNFRGIKEVGGRRIKRSIAIDQSTITFCDADLVDKLQKSSVFGSHIEAIIASTESTIGKRLESNQLTNIEIFIAFIDSYLRSRDDLHQSGKLTFLVRTKEPGAAGFPIEIYVFTKTVDWTQYEKIQEEIFSFLIASTKYFDLRVFQDVTGNMQHT